LYSFFVLRRDFLYILELFQSFCSLKFSSSSFYALTFVETRRDGIPHGYGCITFPNGNRYEGNWANGKRTGDPFVNMLYRCSLCSHWNERDLFFVPLMLIASSS
jgi:hypothetical protein